MTPKSLFKQVWPLILANASVPILGFTDTFVIGNTQNASALAALGVAVLLFNLLYWSFGFLRMSSSAQSAQAAGSGNFVEVGSIYCRALLFSFGIAAMLILLGPFIQHIAFGFFSAEPNVEGLAQEYFNIRLWSAPATLGTYAASGILIGLGHSRLLLALQASLAALNALLDVLLVMVFDYGIRGIAIGTVAAEYLIFLIFALIFFKKYNLVKIFKNRHHFTFEKFRSLGVANTNLLIRTWFLLAGFFWFINVSASFSTNHLAATHLLLQIITFSALVLDAFSYVAESRVGIAIGRGNRSDFSHAVNMTTRYAGISALILGVVWWLVGPIFLSLLTDNRSITDIAHSYLWLTCLYVTLSFAAFQLDGIYIGANLSNTLRNNAVICFGIFFITSSVMTHYWQYMGLWISFVVYVCCRAVSLYITRRHLYRLFESSTGL